MPATPLPVARVGAAAAGLRVLMRVVGWAFVIPALFALVVAASVLVVARDMPRGTAAIVTAAATTSFTVELANTDATREEGLMVRKSMPEDAGMLLDFRKTEPVYFWMKNTYLPLDMLFITADGTIAHIAERATPLSEAVIASQVPVRFVLEVNAGTVQRLGIRPGDRLTSPFLPH